MLGLGGLSAWRNYFLALGFCLGGFFCLFFVKCTLSMASVDHIAYANEISELVTYLLGVFMTRLIYRSSLSLISHVSCLD
jgi:hypothetical protein